MNFPANPYDPSLIHSGDEPSAAQLPLGGYSKVACILFIVLGALGILGAIQVVFGLIASAAGAGGQGALISPFPGALAISLLLSAAGLAISIFDIVGGALGLQQKRAGASIIRRVCAIMLVLKPIECIFGVVYTMTGMDEIMKQATGNMPPDAPEDTVNMIMSVAMFFAVAFTVIISLAMFLFYLFTFLHFKKPTTWAQFHKG